MSTPSEQRLQLLRAGFNPLPLSGKLPVLKEWQKRQATSEGDIDIWAKVHANATNTGILTRSVPCFDIDILNQDAAEAIEQLVRERFEEGGYVLIRIGQSPKRGIPFRTDEAFSKISAVMIPPNGGSEEKLEFLADGQQFVAFGVHPKTHKPYSWFGGEPGAIKRDDLPYIREEQARQLVDDAAGLLVREFGYQRGGERPRKDKGNGAGTGALDWAFLADNIRTGRALHDSLRDLAGKLVTSGMDAGAATNFLRGLMDRAECEHDERWKARRDDIPRLVQTAEKPEEQSPNNTPQRESHHGVTLDDFHAYMPMHSYIYAPSREVWPASSVNARVPSVQVCDANGKPVLDEKGKPKTISASAWLDQNRAVEQMTWSPGLPMLIRDRLISDGGWIKRNGVTCFNLYRPPTLDHGSAARATSWLDHIGKVFGNDSNHILNWLAQRVQRPDDKINHALVLGGAQGIGKDTLLEPVKRAIGPWNFSEVSPQHLLGRFNGFLKSVILRVSEARDLGDINRFQFYDHMKAYTAAPPDVLRVDEKNLREYSVLNCCGVIITTNHKADGIYLPGDDRRHFVAWSELSKSSFDDGYWVKLCGWYANGGDRHVAAYLAVRDLSAFDAKAPPPKTAAFWDIVDANRAPEDAELADVIDDLGNPDATTLEQVRDEAEGDFADWINDRKNRRNIPHRFEKCGYVPIRNDAADDGLWKIGGKRQVVYARSALSVGERIRAARYLAKLL